MNDIPSPRLLTVIASETIEAAITDSPASPRRLYQEDAGRIEFSVRRTSYGSDVTTDAATTSDTDVSTDGVNSGVEIRIDDAAEENKKGTSTKKGKGRRLNEKDESRSSLMDDQDSDADEDNTHNQESAITLHTEWSAEFDNARRPKTAPSRDPSLSSVKGKERERRKSVGTVATSIAAILQRPLPPSVTLDIDKIDKLDKSFKIEKVDKTEKNYIATSSDTTDKNDNTKPDTNNNIDVIITHTEGADPISTYNTEITEPDSPKPENSDKTKNFDKIDELHTDEYGQIELQTIHVDNMYPDIVPYEGEHDADAMVGAEGGGELQEEKPLKQDRLVQKDIVRVGLVALVAVIVVLVFILK